MWFFWAQRMWIIEITVQGIKREIQNRVSVVIPTKLSMSDREWFDNFCKKKTEGFFVLKSD